MLTISLINRLTFEKLNIGKSVLLHFHGQCGAMVAIVGDKLIGDVGDITELEFVGTSWQIGKEKVAVEIGVGNDVCSFHAHLHTGETFMRGFVNDISTYKHHIVAWISSKNGKLESEKKQNGECLFHC